MCSTHIICVILQHVLSTSIMESMATVLTISQCLAIAWRAPENKALQQQIHDNLISLNALCIIMSHNCFIVTGERLEYGVQDTTV